MSGLDVAQNTSAPIATGTSAKTILSYTAPGNTGAKVKRMSIGFDGTSPTAQPIQVTLLQGGTGGTGTNVDPVKLGGHTGSVQGSGKENYSANPTGGAVKFNRLLHPQASGEFPLDIILNPGQMLELRTTAAAAVNCVPSFRIEE